MSSAPVCIGLLALSIVAPGANPALAQEQADAEQEEALELQEVRVTGSRLNLLPSELSGNLIVLDRDDIRATGELTLARVLRQLPQNVNASNETFGSTLNNTTNVTAASTVNLRGLGSEYTLILVDGRRAGYSGITGGVTDVSTIPLTMVERIEIYLDGASAVYGSDAVGGVVNIITRKDYAGVELDLHYARPHKSGYDEQGANLSAGLAWASGRGNVGYEHLRDSGLDASSRDSILLADRDGLGGRQLGRPGPQVRVFNHLYGLNCFSWNAVAWQLDGQVLSRDEWAALNAADRRRATCHLDLTVPEGFMPGDDLNGIEIFGPPQWGEDAELGYSLRPAQRQNAFFASADQALPRNITAHGNVRWSRKHITSNQGRAAFSGILHQNNPYNPFGVRVSAYGQVPNVQPTRFSSERDRLATRVGLEGSFGGSWKWEADLSRTQEDVASQRLNVLPGDVAGRLSLDATVCPLGNVLCEGMNSDGVSEAIIYRKWLTSRETCAAIAEERGGTGYRWLGFLRGQCSVLGPPPEPINPFGDLSAWFLPGQGTGSTNRQIQFEALARGELFRAPGGRVALVLGYDYREEVLDTFSEFHPDTIDGGGPSLLAQEDHSPAGTAVFNTSISRSIQAGFFEGVVPLIGANNAMAAAQRLNLTFSGRYDTYSDADVRYRQSDSGEAGAENPITPGSEFTYSIGTVYQINDAIRLKARRATAFIAPQTAHLIQRAQSREPNRPFGQICFTLADGSGCGFSSNTWEIHGSNHTLEPEIADTLSLTAELSPPFVPGLLLRASWSETEYVNRIVKLSDNRYNINPDNLPSYITYIEEADIYLVDNRYINVSSLKRSGMDYDLRYEWEWGVNEFRLVFRHSSTSRYTVQLDPTLAQAHNLVETRDDTGSQDARIIAPVSRHRSSGYLLWTRGGLSATLELERATRVSTLGTVGIGASAVTFEQVTEPARLYDVVISYQLGGDAFFFSPPEWLRGAQITLTVNNLTDAYAKNYRVIRETGEIEEHAINPLFEWTQGRAYRLGLRKSFGLPDWF